jgi:probable addiction module antidote protein
MNMAVKTTPWDSTDYLQTEEDMAAYLDAVLEEASDDPVFVVQALNTVARARQRNMTQLAKDVGITREGLRKALSAEGDPRLSTLVKLLSALGLRLRIEPAAQPGTAQA